MRSSYTLAEPKRSATLGFFISFLLLLACVAAQAAWPSWLRLRDQTPDLALAAVLSIGLTCGGLSGLTAGFLGAFLWGSVASVPMGNLFLSYMGLGFLTGAMRGRMFADRLLLAAILVGAGEIVASVVNLVLAPPPSAQAWVAAVFARALFSALLTIPLYLLMRFLSRYYPEPEDI